MAIPPREPFLAYLLVRAAMLRRRRAGAPIAVSRPEEHAHALELLADLIRTLPDDDERLLMLSTLAVRDGQFVPGASTEHGLSQFAGISWRGVRQVSHQPGSGCQGRCPRASRE